MSLKSINYYSTLGSTPLYILGYDSYISPESITDYYFGDKNINLLRYFQFNKTYPSKDSKLFLYEFSHKYNYSKTSTPKYFNNYSFYDIVNYINNNILNDGMDLDNSFKSLTPIYNSTFTINQYLGDFLEHISSLIFKNEIPYITSYNMFGEIKIHALSDYYLNNITADCDLSGYSINLVNPIAKEYIPGILKVNRPYTYLLYNNSPFSSTIKFRDNDKNQIVNTTQSILEYSQTVKNYFTEYIKNKLIKVILPGIDYSIYKDLYPGKIIKLKDNHTYLIYFQNLNLKTGENQFDLLRLDEDL